MNRITFRKGKRYSGLMRLPEIYHVSVGGNEVAIMQRDGPSRAWFWYGGGINTYQDMKSFDDCKKSVKEHFKQ